MSDKPKILGVIPARLASTRLPGKVLRTIAGVPMIEWVYRAARACSQLDDVLIATDSEQILTLAREHGWSAMLTSHSCVSGSDRVVQVSQRIPAEIYVNIQGDEPMLRTEHIDALLRPFERQSVEVSTLSTPCKPEEIKNPNAVKVVTAPDGRALYFSRATIPFDRDRSDKISLPEAPRPLRLPKHRARALLPAPAQPSRNNRETRTASLSRKRHRHLRRIHSL